MTEDPTPMTDDPLLERLRQLPVTPHLFDTPAPAPGQIWRSFWEDEDLPTACLVLIVAPPDGRRVEVMPVLSDSETGDDKTAALDLETGSNVCAWTQLLREIPLFTLEHRLTDVTDRSMDALLNSDAAIFHWPSVYSDLDDRALLLADLDDRMTALQEAEWLPAANGDEPLADLVRERGLAPSSLAAALDVSHGEARRLVDGKALPTPAQLSILEGLLGRRPGSAFRIDDACVLAMDQPSLRAKIRSRAEARLLPEAATRQRLAQDAMATGQRVQDNARTNWTRLLEQLLDAD